MSYKMIRKNTTYFNENGFEFTCEPLEDTIEISKTKSGYLARYLTNDTDYESPDKWGDNNLFLVHFHRDFDVRKDNIITEDDVQNWYQSFSKDGSRIGDTYKENKDGTTTKKISQENSYHIFAVSAYIHSGISLSLRNNFPWDSGGWDTSHVGAVLVSKKEFRSEKKAKDAAEGLIKEWNMCLCGDVYTAVIESYNTKKNPLKYDCLSGMYGKEYALQELKGMRI